MEILINHWRGWSDASKEAELEYCVVKTLLDVYAWDVPVWIRKVRGLSWSMMHRLSAFGQFLRVNHTSRKKLSPHTAWQIASAGGHMGGGFSPIAPTLVIA